MKRVLLRKLQRDLWRQRWQFLAAAMVIAIGVAVYVAGTDAYANLKQSVDRAYAVQLLPDAIITGPGVFELRSTAQQLPGDPIVALRQQGDVGIRIDNNTLSGRAISVPVNAQPAVSALALRSGDLPAPGGVAMEEHLTEHYRLKPGDTVELLEPGGWQPWSVSGSASSTEYFWPARSQREIWTSAERFGVVFLSEPDFSHVVAHPVDQLLLYARDRSAASALVTAATELAVSRGLAATSREQQPSFHRVQDDIDSLNTFARLLPWLFLVAAMSSTYVLLSRLITAERAIIGTLSANGLSGPTIGAHYLAYGVVVGLAGTTMGLIGGLLLGGWLTAKYTQALSLPVSVASAHSSSLIVAAISATAAAALAAWIPARAASRASPAEAMRRMSPSPARGGVSVLERLLPPLRRVPARWRMTVRGVTRNRRRALLTICGVVIAVCLVTVFAGLRDTVNRLIDVRYDSIELQDAQVITTAGAADAVAATLRADPRITVAESFTRLDVTIEAHNSRRDTLLIALPRSTDMHRFIYEGSRRELPPEGVLLAQGLAEMLGVTVGDRVEITGSPAGFRIEQPVAGIVDEPSPVGYIAADKMAELAAPSGVMVKLTPDASADEVKKAASALPGVVTYLSTDTITTGLRQNFSLYNTLIGLMQAFAVVMAAALLYNTMSAGVSERTGELSTLRAAGIGTGLLGRLVAAENMILVVLGLPVGLLAGTLLADVIMSTYATEGYHWNLDMNPATPPIVAVAVLTAAFLVQIPVFRIIRRTDLAKVEREHSL